MWGLEHLVRDEVDDILGLLRGRAPPGGDAAPEVPQRRRRESAAVGARCGGGGGERAGEAPGPSLDGEDDDAGLHHAPCGEAGGGGVGRCSGEAERTDSEESEGVEAVVGTGVSEPRRETASFGPSGPVGLGPPSEHV